MTYTRITIPADTQRAITRNLQRGRTSSWVALWWHYYVWMIGFRLRAWWLA